MKYKGKLYGKIGKKHFDTGYTSDDWDALRDALKACVATLEVALDYGDFARGKGNFAKIVERDIRDGIAALRNATGDQRNTSGEPRRS
ncbi:MAG: hypothetical protein LBK99_16615 [Opitutaceae bacterium]|jgi:hypothetical protein|nr:hypothetical protein [Opitutaceae bacterium]